DLSRGTGAGILARRTGARGARESKTAEQDSSQARQLKRCSHQVWTPPTRSVLSGAQCVTGPSVEAKCAGGPHSYIRARSWSTSTTTSASVTAVKSACALAPTKSDDGAEFPTVK